MNRYTLTKKLGDGTYGSVVKAVNRQTGEDVAVKKMKKLFTRWVGFDDHEKTLSSIVCVRTEYYAYSTDVVYTPY